jgi:hypothetical protein
MTATAPLGYADKKQLVEALLRKKFPGSWAPPPIQPLRPGGYGGGSNAGAVEFHQQRMERIEAERKRLAGLPDADLLAMQAEMEAQEKAKREAEHAVFDATFFGRPEMEADYEFWTKAEYWTFAEAIALLLGKEPKKIALWLVEARKKGTPFAQRYGRLEELAKRASAMASARLQPQAVLAWAKSTGAVEEIPAGLLPVLNRPAPTSTPTPQAAPLAPASPPPPVLIPPRELQPPVGVAPEPNWMLQEPQRHQGYSWPLYQVLKEAHAAGQPRPKARDVLEAFKERKPPEIVQVNHDGISYYDSKGNAKAADLAAISEAIRRMTS